MARNNQCNAVKKSKRSKKKSSISRKNKLAGFSYKVKVNPVKHQSSPTESPDEQLHNIAMIMQNYARRSKCNKSHRKLIINQVEKFNTLLQNHHHALLGSQQTTEDLIVFLSKLPVAAKSPKFSYSLNIDDLTLLLANIANYSDSAIQSRLLKSLGELSFYHHLQGKLPASVLETMLQTLLQQATSVEILSDSLKGLRLLSMGTNVSGEIPASLPIAMMKALLNFTPYSSTLTENLYNVALLMQSQLCRSSTDSTKMKALAKLVLNNIELEYADPQQLGIACCYLGLSLPKGLIKKIQAVAPEPQSIQQLLVKRIHIEFPDLVINVSAEKLLGPFFVDVYLETTAGDSIVLEIDGPQHYRQSETLRKKDQYRDTYLKERLGTEVLRINRVGLNNQAVIASIIDVLSNHPLITKNNFDNGEEIEAIPFLANNETINSNEPSTDSKRLVRLDKITNPANTQSSFFYHPEEFPLLQKSTTINNAIGSVKYTR